MLTVMMMGAALAADQDVPLALDLAPDTASVVAVDVVVGMGTGSFLAGQPARGALDLTLQGGWWVGFALWRASVEDRLTDSITTGDMSSLSTVRGEAWALGASGFALKMIGVVRAVRSAEKSKRERWAEAYGVGSYDVPAGPSRAELEEQASRVILLVLGDDVPMGSEAWFDLTVAVGQAMNQGHDAVSIRDAAVRGRAADPACLPGDCVRAGLPE